MKIDYDVDYDIDASGEVELDTPSIDQTWDVTRQALADLSAGIAVRLDGYEKRPIVEKEETAGAIESGKVQDEPQESPPQITEVLEGSGGERSVVPVREAIIEQSSLQLPDAAAYISEEGLCYGNPRENDEASFSYYEMDIEDNGESWFVEIPSKAQALEGIKEQVEIDITSDGLLLITDCSYNEGDEEWVEEDIGSTEVIGVGSETQDTDKKRNFRDLDPVHFEKDMNYKEVINVSTGIISFGKNMRRHCEMPSESTLSIYEKDGNLVFALPYIEVEGDYWGETPVSGSLNLPEGLLGFTESGKALRVFYKGAVELVPVESEKEKEKLKDVSGIEKEHVIRLHNNGLQCISDLRGASQDELAGVPGIGNALAARIKADVGEKTPSLED